MNAYRHAARALLASIALVPALAIAAEPGCKYIEVGRIPLRYSGPELDITTEGSIDGTPATMLVDTGMFDTVLTKAAADRRKLALRSTRFDMEGVGGAARIYETRVTDFSIGPARTSQLWLPVLQDFASPPHYEARVGAPFLLQADMEISLAEKQMKFFRPAGCDDSFLGYWDEHAIVLPFERGPRYSVNPHFTVVVNGVEMDAIIDSGASTSFVTLDAAKRAGLALGSPELTRAADAVGIGTRTAARWRTTFKRFEIGDEIVRNAEIGVVDYKAPAEVSLGADFLRSHRVLFAMSQKKLYLSYVGGPPFGQRHRLEPWIQTEADAGNADANILAGHLLLLNSEYAAAAKRLRAGLDKLPAHPRGALGLYLARMHTGQPDLAKTELAQTRAANSDNAWPAPIADFYLGKLGAEKLLEAAAVDGKLAADRSCEALQAMTYWHSAHGDKAALPPLLAQRTALGCPIVAVARVQPAPG